MQDQRNAEQIFMDGFIMEDESIYMTPAPAQVFKFQYIPTREEGFTMPIDHSVTWQKTAPTATLFAQVPYVALSSARGALRFASYVRSRALRGLEIDSHLTMLCSMVDELVSDRPHCKYAIGAKEEIGHCAELIEYLYAGTQFDRLFVNAFWRNLSRAIFNLSLVGGS